MTRQLIDGGTRRASSDVSQPTVPLLRSTAAELSLGTLFELLQDKERRLLLYHLADADESWVAVDDLVAQLARAHHGSDEPADGDPRLALTHVHLPKLDAADLVEYDPDSGQLKYEGHPLLEQWLRQTREMDLG